MLGWGCKERVCGTFEEDAERRFGVTEETECEEVSLEDEKGE